jgi:hypothetical protein
MMIMMMMMTTVPLWTMMRTMRRKRFILRLSVAVAPLPSIFILMIILKISIYLMIGTK